MLWKLTAWSFTAIHWECLRIAAIPPLNVFLMVPFLCKERWLPPSSPPRARHRGGREILGVNMAFTTPLGRAEREPSYHRMLKNTFLQSLQVCSWYVL